MNLLQQTQETFAFDIRYSQVNHYIAVFSVDFSGYYIQRYILGFYNFIFV